MAERVLASREFEAYVQKIDDGFIVEDCHRELFESLEAMERGEFNYLVVELPPRTGKSSVISKYFPSWILGRNQKNKIVCTSYGSELAKSFGRHTKQIVSGEDYQNIFDVELADDKKEGGNWETKQGGGYYSVGVGGALTGIGFDWGFIDDPVKNREEAESITYRNKVWDWYTSTFLTRKQGSNAKIVILMTRWNTDDLVGRIMENEPDKWRRISFPAIDEHGKALINRDGFGLEFYEEQRKSIGERDFQALYQQDPIKSSGNVFKEADFGWYALSELNKDDFNVSISVDPAFSTNTNSDSTAIITTAQHKQTKEIYVLDMFCKPVAPSEAYKYTLSQAEKWSNWSFSHISIEDVTFEKQKMFIDGFNRFLQEQGKFYTVLMCKTNKNKEDRIKFNLEPMFNRHAIYFNNEDKYNEGFVSLKEQILKFPALAHDDAIDSLSQAVEMWSQRSGSGSNDIDKSMEEHTAWLRSRR